MKRKKKNINEVAHLTLANHPCLLNSYLYTLISHVCRPRCWYQLSIFSPVFALPWIQPALRRFTQRASSALSL